jgi:Bacteriophage CII protein
MEAVSINAHETARKGFAFLLQRLASVGQAPIAEALGVSEATVSRIKNDDLERVCLLIALLGGKIVPFTVKCYAPSVIEPLLALAKQRMAQIDSVAQLEWADE